MRKTKRALAVAGAAGLLVLGQASLASAAIDLNLDDIGESDTLVGVSDVASGNAVNACDLTGSVLGGVVSLGSDKVVECEATVVSKGGRAGGSSEGNDSLVEVSDVASGNAVNACDLTGSVLGGVVNLSSDKAVECEATVVSSGGSSKDSDSLVEVSDVASGNAVNACDVTGAVLGGVVNLSSDKAVKCKAKVVAGSEQDNGDNADDNGDDADGKDDGKGGGKDDGDKNAGVGGSGDGGSGVDAMAETGFAVAGLSVVGALAAASGVVLRRRARIQA